ncbi:hypothetical protein [uncultured Nonlabens sp.]|uniref:hypothetical protein n=1 Tax=uncultured Nonlabens sp. TaxID=859306 RepID=UPI00262BBB26|nr:hypothetical protein [uncultured Nonlabens sp.]
MDFKEHKQFLSAFFIIAAGGLLFYFAKPYLPSKLFVENTTSSNIAVDSLMLRAMKEFEQAEDSTIVVVDSIVIPAIKTDSIILGTIPTDSIPAPVIQQVSYSDLIKVDDFDFNLERPTDSTGKIAIPSPLALKSYKGINNLKRFFEKLYELDQSKEGKIRIAYYGDSMIDGDLIVQDFRSSLQTRFGGSGVGFVSIKSESARSRYSVKHYASGNWTQRNYMKARTDSLPYGVNGAIFFPVDSTASVKYLASGIKNSYRLNSPRLFYGPATDNTLLKVTKEKDTTFNTIALKGKNGLNTVNLSSKNLKKIELDFSGAQNTPIYGIDFSDATGIAVDGFSSRGNSGLPLSILNIGQMRKFDQVLSYDLIILQFGANVLTHKSKNYNWYSSRMTKVIHHLQQAFPDADILILGTADKGTKFENIIKTDTSVVKLLRAQQHYAAKTESGFMSLFHLMGGVNTMPIWTDQKLANDDFTHFSSRGSRKIGRMIYGSLMEDYSAFAKARSKQLQLQIERHKEDSLATSILNDSLKNIPLHD